MANVVTAIKEFLEADTAVASLSGTRVYGGELPPSQNTSMPRSAVVVKRAGGGFLGQAYQDYGDVRVDVDCYGSTPFNGDELYNAVYAALKHMQREVSDGLLLHWARASSKGISARDPDTDWPVTVSSWQVLASEVAV